MSINEVANLRYTCSHTASHPGNIKLFLLLQICRCHLLKKPWLLCFWLLALRLSVAPCTVNADAESHQLIQTKLLHCGNLLVSFFKIVLKYHIYSKNICIIRIQTDDFSQIQHSHDSRAQFKHQNVAVTAPIGPRWALLQSPPATSVTSHKRAHQSCLS